MLIELAQDIFNRSDIPKGTVEVLVTMIVVPFMYALRGFALIGISAPCFLIFVNLRMSTGEITSRVGRSILWMILNTYIFLSPVDVFWKWLWVDIVGLLIVNSIFYTWNARYMVKKYMIK